ncbi:MAG: beta-Ala-His dipeptidase [Clostridia bacterium]|nr:beta-Ala-His dipeptidase [Clostridia bacterium]
MEYIINGYRHASFFHYFEDISRIPRGSGNEAGIAAFLKAFADERGIECTVDEYHNVFMRKHATPGYEDVAPILLQGHTDMVCEKNADSDHDFTKDPLSLYIDKNGLLRAKGTTLGGDDGVAVALMLSLLDDESLQHPTLECLFTSAEETGLYGAHGFDCSQITARRMLNLDTELDGEAISSCAGSADLLLTLDTDREACDTKTVDITVKGLAGGHSGTDINTCRANAIRMMGRILAKLYDDCPFHLVSIAGGNKRNAVPRECVARITALEPDRAIALVEEEFARLKKEVAAADKKLRVTARLGKRAENRLSYHDTSTVISMITLNTNGVVSMSPVNPEFVRTSANMGVITTEEGKITASIMARSSCDSEMDALLLSYKRLAKLGGWQYLLDERSSGWDMNADSQLAKDYLRIYKRLYPDSNPVVNGIHAGLECGIFVSKIGCDALSVGPTIYEVHSPNEALDLASCERFCDLVRAMVSEKA